MRIEHTRYRREDGYHESERLAAHFHRLLGHPARIRLLRQLMQKRATASQLGTAHSLARTTVCRHLATLRHGGLVTYAENGDDPIYIATPHRWPDWLHGYLVSEHELPLAA